MKGGIKDKDVLVKYCLEDSNKILEEIDEKYNFDVIYLNSVIAFIKDYIIDCQEVLLNKTDIAPELIEKILIVKSFEAFTRFYLLSPTDKGIEMFNQIMQEERKQREKEQKEMH